MLSWLRIWIGMASTGISLKTAVGITLRRNTIWKYVWMSQMPGKESVSRTILCGNEGFLQFLVPSFTKLAYSSTSIQCSCYAWALFWDTLPLCHLLVSLFSYLVSSIWLLISLVRQSEIWEGRWRGLCYCPKSVRNLVILFLNAFYLWNIAGSSVWRWMGMETL